MKFKTIDGKEFDCELEALSKQAQMYHEAIKNMVCKHDVNAIRMDTDRLFLSNTRRD